MNAKIFPLLIACGSAWFASLAIADVTRSALHPATPSTTAGTDSYAASMTPDARYVLFFSRAGNLASNYARSSATDVFLRDRANGTTILVSVNHAGVGGGDADSISPAVSRDGRWVVFESASANLVPGDSNGVSDIFLRDVASRTTVKVSTAPTGEPANQASEAPQISEDGRWIIYESQAENLIAGETNLSRELFAYDRIERNHQRLSAPFIPPAPIVITNGPAHSASLTPDARQVAYVRSGSNRIGQTYVGEILSWDARTSTTHWLSAGIPNFNENPTSAFCFHPTISGDGSVVVFKNSLGGGPILLHRQANPPQPNLAAEIIGNNATAHGWVSVSASGLFIAYEATDGIRLWDAQSSSNGLVLANLPAPNRRVCSKPALSADGNSLLFLVTSNLASSAGVPNHSTGLVVHDRLRKTTTEVPLNGTGLPTRISDAVVPLFSVDGRTVVFDSSDATLFAGDDNRAGDVFSFDLGTAQLDCISVRASDRPSVTPGTPSHRWSGSFSANGRVVAVSAPDFGADDTNRFHDLYIRDLGAGRQHFLGQPTNTTRYPALSANGRYVAYLSANLRGYLVWNSEQTASVWRRNLQTGDEIMIHPRAVSHGTVPCVAISPDGNQVAFVVRLFDEFSNGHANVYVHNIDTGATTLVSPSHAPAPFPPTLRESDGDSLDPRFTPDGRWILFGSPAGNLVPGPNTFGFGLYARELAQQKTYRMSSNRSSAFPLAIGANSRHVACTEDTGDSSGRLRVTVFDLESHQGTPVPGSDGARTASIDANGRWVAYDRLSEGWNIYVHDRVQQTAELITRDHGENDPIPTRDSSHPAISHDGRYVVFMSSSDRLVVGDTNRVSDIFIRDRQRGLTLLASINRDGTASGNGPSVLPVLAADGRALLFQSMASDLIDGDYNEASDVFVLRLVGDDGDGDGMADDWEVAYFGDLARNGSGDFDADGINDSSEHRLGTDPTNAGSVFQVLALSREGVPGAKLLWSAVPGNAYRVQFKDDLAPASVGWSDATEIVTAAGTTAAWTDRTVSSSKRFYRVVLVQ